MADMTNAIANFGWQAGQNIQKTVGNALARNEERRRYENKMTAYNQAREDQAAQQQEAAEREYGKGWATAYFTAPEDKRDLILKGGVQKAMQQGYIKPEEAGAINDGYMYRLAAETGVDFGRGGDPANIQEFNMLADVINNPDRFPKETVAAARIKAGLDPRAVGSSQMTIVNTGMTDPVAQSQGVIAGTKAGATETAKLQAQGQLKPTVESETARAVEGARQEQKLSYEPRIKSAVKAAEVEAAARGETLDQLKKAQAALPGLNSAIESLRELAPIATTTTAGKLWDGAVKELGFGATEGATARAKFIAIINNQVLPLLKPTFGAAFTVQEGESLKKAMADPDAAPEAKLAQLDAFIAQKYRDIETKQRETGVQSAPPGYTLMQDANGNKAYVGPNGEIQEL